MDRNYLSVTLTVWHLKAAIDEIRPITIENSELSICTEGATAVQRHLYLHSATNVAVHQISNFRITFRKRV